jgi:hypothetical protein
MAPEFEGNHPVSLIDRYAPGRVDGTVKFLLRMNFGEDLGGEIEKVICAETLNPHLCPVSGDTGKRRIDDAQVKRRVVGIGIDL